MDPLLPMLEHLERNAGTGLTRAGWRGLCGGMFSQLESLLTPSGELAVLYPSPFLNMPPLRVHCHQDGSITGLCDDDPTTRLDLSVPDIELFEITPTTLRREVAKALRLQTSRQAVTRLPGVLSIGLLEAASTAAYPVVLVAHPCTTTFGNLVRQSVLADKRPVLVMTPTDAAWTDELREWVEDRRGTLVPLTDIVGVDRGGGLVATELWAGFRGTFLERAGFCKSSIKPNRRRPGLGRDAKLKAISVEVERELKIIIRGQSERLRNATAAGKTEITFPRVSQKDIARLAGHGCKPYHITRLKKSGKYPRIERLLGALGDAEKLRKARL